MPDPQAARAIQGHLKELVKSLKKYDSCRKGSEGGLDAIREQHRWHFEKFRSIREGVNNNNKKR